jgi:ferric-dicitrate binding protein FerR (iron transport regulator)
MNARMKSRVEPLSRPAWERVEARLFERLEQREHLAPPAPLVPSRPAARLWLGVAALAAAAAILTWWQVRAPVAPLAVERTPAAEHAPALSAPRPAVSEGAHIVTTSAPTRTTIGEATLILAAASEAHVAGSDADGWLVRLDRGEVDCEVAPRQGRPPFVVQAGETRVTVVGTRFTVLRDGAGASVSVREGRVQVASGAHRLSLGPGERWPSDLDDSTVEAPPELDTPKVAAGSKVAQARRRAAARAAASGAQFARAARLEATDPDAALGIYRKLAGGKGRWAANALYAEARLELERGRRERARLRLERYLARHPSGANVSDVRTLLERLVAGAP